MENKNSEASPHVIYGVIFSLIALVAVGGLVMVKSQADTSSGSGAVTNSAPTLSALTVTIGSAMSSGGTATLTDNTDTTITVAGTATDLNSCEEVDAKTDYTVMFYRTDKGTTCIEDANDCYYFDENTDGTIGTGNTCVTGGSDTTVNFSFTDLIAYYADSTVAGGTYPGSDALGWTARVVVNDGTANSSASTLAFEIGMTTGLDVSTTLAYGTLALGAASGSDVTATITNTANRLLDYTIQTTTDWTCTIGTFPSATYLKYDIQGSTAWATMDGVIPSVSATSINSDIAVRTAGVSSGSLYTRLSLPTQGIAGSCSSVVTFTAVGS